MRDVELLTWRDVAAALRRRRGLIWRVGAAGMVLMALVAFALPPKYRAEATLLVTATRTRSISPDAEALPLLDRVTEEDLNSQAELLRSPALIRQVLAPQVAEGKMPTHGVLSRVLAMPREAGRALYRMLHGVPAPNPLDEWVADVHDHLYVGLVKKTNLIEVAYRQRGVDPAWASALVNSLVDGAIRQQVAAGQQSEATQFFHEQRRLQVDRVQQAEAAKREFFAREGLDAVPEQRTLLRTRLHELTVSAQDTEAALASVQARAASLEREIARHPETVAKEVRRAQNQSVQFIKPRVLDKEFQRNELLSKYTRNNSRVQDVERELRLAKRRLAAEPATVAETTTAMNPTHQLLESALAESTVETAALQARVDALRAHMDATRAAIAHFDGVAAEHSRLEQELVAANEAFATYTRKQEQARLGSALDASRIVNVAVVEPARVPDSPERSHGLILVVLAGLLSIGLGVAAALGSELLDPAVRSARDAEIAAGAPVLAEVPG
ncbi:MAG: GumC family protein [Candidatus Binatia bacterium]